MLSTSNSTNKANSINDRKSKTVNKVETMVAELTIEVMRYQAFMDEPLPAYFTPEFLDDFKQLPTTFYSPNAPEKFQDFIERWGTHVVKSVMLGAKFRMLRTSRNDGSVSIDEFQRQTQNEFDRVTGSSYGHNVQYENEAKSAIGASLSGGSTTGSSSVSVAAGTVDVNNNANSVDETTASADESINIDQIRAKQVNTAKKSVKFDSINIDTEGGSHLIAASITDLYSPGFKADLKAWLESVPTYPKAFNFQFQPLSEMLKGNVV